jgi:hypothetical protein
MADQIVSRNFIDCDNVRSACATCERYSHNQSLIFTMKLFQLDRNCGFKTKSIREAERNEKRLAKVTKKNSFRMEKVYPINYENKWG